MPFRHSIWLLVSMFFVSLSASLAQDPSTPDSQVLASEVDRGPDLSSSEGYKSRRHSEPRPDLEILYTGRLFGYYRMEASEREPKLATVSHFLSSRQNHPNAILLGMGENFGPEFGASLQERFEAEDSRENSYHALVDLKVISGANSTDDPCARNVPFPKSADAPDFWEHMAPVGFYKSSSRLPKHADCDNVVRFLLRAGYQAIVPGREDFMYSGTWLRHVALLLNGGLAPDEVPDSGPKILAANLRVGVSTSECPLLFAANLGGHTHLCAPNVDGATTAEMRWFERVAETLDHGKDSPVARRLLRQALVDSEFRKQVLINQGSILTTLLLAYGCKSPLDSKPEKSLLEDAGYNNSDPGVLRLTELTPVDLGRLGSKFSNMTCTSEQDQLRVIGGDWIKAVQSSTEEPQSQPQPLWNTEVRVQIYRLLLRQIFDEQRNIGFRIANIPGSKDKHVLIVGVVGKETFQDVSCSNFQVTHDSSDTPFKPIKPACGSTSPDAAQIRVGDPLVAAELVIRAAWEAREEGLVKFERIIVMAEMPPSESEELNAHLAGAFESHELDKANDPRIDLVISEAQSGHETKSIGIHYDSEVYAPVVSPPDASRYVNQGGQAFSVATFSGSAADRTLTNVLLARQGTDSDQKTASMLLKEQIDLLDGGEKSARATSPIPRARTDFQFLWDQCQSEEDNCRNQVLMQYLLQAMMRLDGSDVALLKRRDFYFGSLAKSYSDYDSCSRWLSHPPKDVDVTGYQQLCQLHVALDRVLWEGDYTERVAVDGATLSGLLKTAAQQSDQERTLLARDFHQEWLMTYGVISSPPENLVDASSGPEAFSVPGNSGCRTGTQPVSKGGDPASGKERPYCINGQAIVSDRTYTVATSDHLAQDESVYGALGAAIKKAKGEIRGGRVFLSQAIERELIQPRPPVLEAVVKRDDPEGMGERNESVEKNIAVLEVLHQTRPVLQVDFAKASFGFAETRPSLTDSQLGQIFSGVANSQATSAHSEEFDLEMASRQRFGPEFVRWSFGTQSDSAYDRKVLGNTSGNPEAVNQQSNSYTAGGFAQLHLTEKAKDQLHQTIDRSTRNLQALYIVVAPFQAQGQWTGTLANFTYSANSKLQRTIHLPILSGESDRLGFRYEAASGKPWWRPDVGSYFEVGTEYTIQHGVLSELDANQVACPVSAQQSLSACLKGKGATIDANTVFRTFTKTVKEGGLYWDIHLQKQFSSKSVTIESKGDDYLLPGATLATQTRYAWTTNFALNFPLWGNFTLSPTWSEFFFENQGEPSDRKSMHSNSVKVVAKWYFGRDASVPFRRQLLLSGPASGDQTGTAKLK